MGDAAFRYRKLIPHGPRDTRADSSGFDIESAAFDSALSLAGGTQQVAAEEGTTDLATLEQMLRAKALMKSDLVFSHGQWRSFADAPEFSDLCETLVDTRAMKATVRAALIIIGFVVAYGLYNAWMIATHAPTP